MRTLTRAAAAVAALVAGVVVAPTATATAAPAPATPVPVAWHTCPADALPTTMPPGERTKYSCADYNVPLDHDRPRLGTISIAMLRRAADSPTHRIGSLFLNPGGPGGSGFALPTVASRIVQPAVLDRFDIIGFDPRGIGRSTTLRCFATAEDAAAVNAKIAAVPYTRKEIRDTIEGTREYGQYCDRFAGPLLAHMSTQDVARDLDLMRAGVGDDKLNYLGFSYGTLLGATYVNLFPQRSRAIVLDGNVDPALRTSDGSEYDHQRTAGFEISLDAFLKECDKAGPLCAYSGGARAKFDESREYLKTHGPVKLSDGTEVTYGLFVSATGSILYSRPELPDLARLLQELYDIIHPSLAPHPALLAPGQAASLLSGNTRLDNPDSPYTGDDSYAAVNCSDKPFHNKLTDVPRTADRWDREMPTYGRHGAWGDQALCAEWPVFADRYAGPWDRKTPNPVLVFSNYNDPATRYQFGQRMAAELGNSRLVSVDAFGHCILGDSTCTDRIAADYLVNLKVPAPGQVCAPDLPVFPKP